MTDEIQFQPLEAYILQIFYVLKKQGIEKISKAELYEILNTTLSLNDKLEIKEEDYDEYYRITEDGMGIFEKFKRNSLH